MESEGNDVKVGPFLNKQIKAADEEQELLKFLRVNWHVKDFNEGMKEYFYGRLGLLIEEKNALIDKGITGREFEEVLYRIAQLELFAAKWSKLMTAYKENK